jgi:hypothetical protein
MPVQFHDLLIAKSRKQTFAGDNQFLTVAVNSAAIADFRWNRMKIAGKSKADLGFRRNRPFVAGTRNSEPAIQRRKSVVPFSGRQRGRKPKSATGRFLRVRHEDFRCAT